MPICSFNHWTFMLLSSKKMLKFCYKKVAIKSLLLSNFLFSNKLCSFLILFSFTKESFFLCAPRTKQVFLVCICCWLVCSYCMLGKESLKFIQDNKYAWFCCIYHKQQYIFLEKQCSWLFELLINGEWSK